MCGIVGFKAKQYFQPCKEDLPGAVETLSHRGPDDSGCFIDDKAGVGLGHRRLSIIDLSAAGRQPKGSENGKYSITYNGEVYNFLEIRKALEKSGHRFTSRTDTEVILKAYMEWGIGCIDRFNGMFAFCIWDQQKQELFLARDRLGIKPLYYYHQDGTFIFGSELKALMAFRQYRPAIDFLSVSLFLHYQYIPAPRTIFEHTHKLLPGHYLIVNKEKLVSKEYWRLPEIHSSYQFRDEELLIDGLDERISQSVSDRLVADVPIGALLSGGIDSSLVTALMQKVNASTIQTFSIGFEESDYNEARWAARIAGHLNTDHTELYVTPQAALDVVSQLPEIYDEPFADSSAIPTYLVSRLTRSKVKVAISGDGGDEQFCGYVRYWSVQEMDRALKRFPAWFNKEVAVLMKALPYRWISGAYLSLYPYLPQRFRIVNFQDKWHKFIRLLDQSDMEELYRMTICLWTKDQILKLYGRQMPVGEFETAFEHTDQWAALDRMMYVDQKTYLPDAMLTKVDRASMASGLEIRVPLLDHRVVEYSAAIPHQLKYREGTGKYPLKKLLSRYIPKELFERPKMGFGIPIEHWLRKELRNLLLDTLSPTRLAREGLFNAKMIERAIKEHLSGQVNHQYRLWTLLIWELWQERWRGL